MSFLTPSKKKISYTVLFVILFTLLFFSPLKFIGLVPLVLGASIASIPVLIYQYLKGPAICPPGAMCEPTHIFFLVMVVSLLVMLLVLYVFACFLVEKPLSKKI